MTIKIEKGQGTNRNNFCSLHTVVLCWGYNVVTLGIHFALVGRRDCNRVELRHLSPHLNPFPQTNTGGDTQEESLCQSHAPQQVGDSRKSTSPPQAWGSSSRNSEKWMRQALSSWVTHTYQCTCAGTRNSSTPGRHHSATLARYLLKAKEIHVSFRAPFFLCHRTATSQKDIETLSMDPGVKVTRSSRSQTTAHSPTSNTPNKS